MKFNVIWNSYDSRTRSDTIFVSFSNDCYIKSIVFSITNFTWLEYKPWKTLYAWSLWIASGYRLTSYSLIGFWMSALHIYFSRFQIMAKQLLFVHEKTITLWLFYWYTSRLHFLVLFLHPSKILIPFQNIRQIANYLRVKDNLPRKRRTNQVIHYLFNFVSIDRKKRRCIAVPSFRSTKMTQWKKYWILMTFQNFALTCNIAPNGRVKSLLISNYVIFIFSLYFHPTLQFYKIIMMIKRTQLRNLNWLNRLNKFGYGNSTWSCVLQK